MYLQSSEAQGIPLPVFVALSDSLHSSIVTR